MKKTDLSKMQEELVKSLSEFSKGIASIWSDATNNMGIQQVPDARLNLNSGWWAPSVLPKAKRDESPAEPIRRALKTASEDLPELINSLTDPAKVGRIADRWAKSSAKSLDALFGLPAPSEMERLQKRWRSVLNDLTALEATAGRPETASPVGLMWPGFGPLGVLQDVQREWFRLWTETYSMVFGKELFGQGSSRDDDLRERARKAVEAQIRFLDRVAEFQGHIFAASRKAAERAIRELERMNLKELTPEATAGFLREWISAHRSMWQELFTSEPFLKIISTTVQEGLDAGRQMQTAMGAIPSQGSALIWSEGKNLREKVNSLEKRILLLEKEMGDLKGKRKVPSLNR